jgi:NADH:ubiquinone oxidoreductase subunit E
MTKTVEKILLDYEPNSENILAVLKSINKIFGFISKKDAQKTATYFGLPASKIYETASFYDLIETKRQPSLYIKLCSSIHCSVNQSELVKKAIENYFKIKAGDEFHPKVKIKIISCVGECGKGPIMFVNDRMYSMVKVGDIYEIFSHYV